MRLFIGISLDPEIVERIIGFQEEIKGELGNRRDAKIRWQTRDQLHLTLKFLGEVSAERVPDIEEALVQAVSPHSRFPMTISGNGCFPSSGQVRIIWIGVQEGSGVLTECYGSLEEGLNKIGFTPEKRGFSPHITLARVKADNTRGELRNVIINTEFPPVSQQVAGVRLFQSVLKTSGAEYRVVREAVLQDRVANA